MKRNTILYIGLVVLICMFVAYLVFNVRFGFVHLIPIFAILMGWQMAQPSYLNANGDEDKNQPNQPMHPKYARHGIFCLLIMLILIMCSGFKQRAGGGSRPS